MSRYPNGVGIYDLNGNLILKLKNNSKHKPANHLNISRVTVSKNLNSGEIYSKNMVLE